MQINGIIKSISETVQISARFQKRDFVLITEHTTQYPQFVQLELTQEKCTLIDKYKVDDEVSADFNIRGKEWQGPNGVKYFISLNVWKIELVNYSAVTAPIEQPAEIKTEPAKNTPLPLSNLTSSAIIDTSEHDNLPF